MEAVEIFNWQFLGSLVAMVAMVSGFLQSFLPPEYRDYVADSFIQWLSPYTCFVIPEFEGGAANELFVAVKIYLSTLTAKRARKSHLSKFKMAKKITASLASMQRIRDTFNGVRVEWLQISQERKNSVWLASSDSQSDERRSFEVKLPRAHNAYIQDCYFPHIMQRAKEIKRVNSELNLYSNKKIENGYGKSSAWVCIPFRHPASFDTIAMDPELKLSITNDLDDFLKGEEFYRRVGKAWKRGYLLFGPPGTGKTSVVAAMANRLHYDIYDLELTEVGSNADLRTLLLFTSNKSIIVIEDIDCSLDLTGQRKKKKKKKKTDAQKEKKKSVPPHLRTADDDKSKVTLSGLLNFTDGLWSSCESERIFVFTTNFFDKLDPALVRAGRMDMHINLSYCGFPAFKILAKNFLQTSDHPRFPEVELLIDGSLISPAEVAEVLTKYRNDPDTAVEQVMEALREHKSRPPPNPTAPADDNSDESDDSDA